MTDPRAALGRARLYLVAGVQIGSVRTADLVPDLASAGVDVFQLREKDLSDAAILDSAPPIAAACYDAGIPFVVNDRPDVAAALQADGVHLGQDDLPVVVGRRILPDGIVGRSTHSASQIDAETSGTDRPDYVAVGPVFETPTKPGRPATGLELISYAAERVGMPWFAIGGIDTTNLQQVIDSGARRVVVVRAITEAADPPAAAAELRTRLDATAL